MTTQKLLAIDAERMLERCSSEPEFERQLRAAYRGRHDVLDALWWAAHPQTASPGGVDDPATALRELQRAAFSRSAADAPGEVQQAEQRLREAERTLAADHQSLTDAVASVRQSEPVLAERPEPGPPTDDPGHPRRKYVLPLVSIAAVLVAIVAFPTLSGINADADSAPAPIATAPSAERVQTEIITMGSEGNVGDPLAILDRGQFPEDRPADDTRWEPESYRALPDLVPHARLFLARDQQGSVCLVVMRGREGSMETCAPESHFVALRLASGRYEVTPELTILTESYSLLPGGEFRYQATARRTGQGPPVEGSIISEAG